MGKVNINSIDLSKTLLWDKLSGGKRFYSLEMEITWRCNNNCRHCCIRLSSGDIKAQRKELSLVEIKQIIDQAVDLGALWFLITGGEPLLRKDFQEIYLYAKKKGLLVSVFTNATLINKEHVKLFKAYPPRDIEVSVYGLTSKTYARVTGNLTSFSSFKKGLGLLFKNNIKVRLKAVAMRSNLHEMKQIARFCRKHTCDYFRFDPFLQLHFRRDPVRNQLIKSERLNAKEVVYLENNDKQRLQGMQNTKECLVNPKFKELTCNHIFHCGSGKGNAIVSCDGFVRPCFSLVHPDYMFDIKKHSLAHIYNKLFPLALGRRSFRKEFLSSCHRCELLNLCRWCPGESYLENGELDLPVKYLCEIAKARRRLFDE